jgi:RNase P/RNase MRP subunit p29
LTLMACRTGSERGRGGAADDFQRALAGLGYRQPVVAPTTPVGFSVFRDGVAWQNYLVDGGRWEQFSSGAAQALGRVSGDVRWIAFDPAAVRSEPWPHGERQVGVSFRTGQPAVAHGEVPGEPLRRRAFRVAVESDVDGSLVVRTADGVRVHVDGRTFARVLGQAGGFVDPSGSRWPGAIALITSGPVDGAAFQRTLLREFGVMGPVHEPRGAVHLVDGGERAVAENGWTTHGREPRPAREVIHFTPAFRSERADGTLGRPGDVSDVSDVDARLAAWFDEADRKAEAPAPVQESAPVDQVPTAERGAELKSGRSWVKRLFGRESMLSGLDAATGEARTFHRRDVVAHTLTSEGRTVGMTFRTGTDRVTVPVTATQGSVFHVDADATTSRFGLTLKDGTRVTVDGGVLAEVVAKAKPFRAAGALAGVALPGANAGVFGHAGGAAHDFQRGLAAFGRDTAVVAEEGHGRWRGFGGAVAGIEDSGRVRLFGTADVPVEPVRDGDTVVGVSFRGAADESMRAPGPDASVVAVENRLDRFQLTLADGTRVSVGGSAFADVLTSSPLFHQARESRGGEVALLASRAGASGWRGGAAVDFQAALSDRLGVETRVVAPANDLTAHVDGLATIAEDAEIEAPDPSWRMFPIVPMDRPVQAGHFERGVIVDVTPADVQVVPLVKDGRVLGVTFSVDGDGLETALSWAAADGKGTTSVLPQGVGLNEDTMARALDAQAGPAPWPENTFFVVGHSFASGDTSGFRLHDREGAALSLYGHQFADLVRRLEPFQERMSGPDRPEAIALVVCTVAEDRPGTAAHDFQQAMSTTFGVDVPVLAPTDSVYIGLRDGRAATALEHGGEWLTFSGGYGQVLGTDGQGRHVPFAPEEVRSQTVRDGDRPVGLSFADGHGPVDPARWPAGAIGLDVTASGDRFSVTLTDGRTVTVDGRALAKLVMASPAFREAAGAQRPTAFMVSEGSEKGVSAFQRTVARSFGLDVPAVVQRDGEWTAHAEPAQFAGTGADGRVELFTRPAVVVEHSAAGVSFTGDPLPDGGAPDEFRVAVSGSHDRFELRLTDGRQVAVSGRVLADLVHGTGVPTGERITLLGSSAGEIDGPGGAAHDFQRALAGRFEVWQPVSAATQDGTVRTFQTLDTLPRPLSGIELPSGDGGRRPITFQAGTISAAPLRHGDQVVGVTFRTGEERLDSQAWAAAGGGTGTTHLLGADEFNLAEATESGAVRQSQAPWPARTFHVDVEEYSGASMLVETQNGRKVVVDAGTLAAIVARSEPFQQAYGGAPEAITLLVSGGGAPGGAVEGFQRALHEQFGRTEPIYAPTNDLELAAAGTVVHDAGEWRRVEPAPEPAGVPMADRGAELKPGRSWLKRVFGRETVLAGLDAATGEARTFHRRDVVGQVLTSEGRTVGVTFRSGTDSVAVPVTATQGSVFHVDVDASADRFGLTLKDGSRITVDGGTLAGVVAKAKPFRTAGALAGVALPGTAAGAFGHDGGAAHDFQHALAAAVVAEDGQGRWRGFGGVVAGTDATGRVRVFTAADVPVEPIRAGDSIVGVSFRGAVNEPAAGPFQVAVDGDAERFHVTLADGTRVALGGSAFADLLAAHSESREVTLLASRAGAYSWRGGAAHDFQAALSDRLGVEARVTAAAGELAGPATTWRELPEWPLDRPAQGYRIDLGGYVDVDPADLRVEPLVENGRTVGVVFGMSDDDVAAAHAWVAAGGRDTTSVLPQGVDDINAVEGALQAQSGPAPWPANTFFVVGHSFGAQGGSSGFRVHDHEGAVVSLYGHPFADLVRRLEPFQERMSGQDRPDAIALIVCTIGDDRAGEAAHDFQNALSTSFDHDLPVLASTDAVHIGVRDGRAVTALNHGGRWNTFSGGYGLVLGTDATGRVAPFRAEDVRSHFVDQPVGVSFTDGPQWTGTEQWPDRAAGVDVHAVADRFRVTLADGRQLTVDGPAFAKVLVASSAFRELIAAGAPTALVVTDGAPSAVREFQARLASTFYVHTPVLAPGAEWTVYAGLPLVVERSADGRVHLVQAPEAEVEQTAVEDDTRSEDAWSVAGEDSASESPAWDGLSVPDLDDVRSVPDLGDGDVVDQVSDVETPRSISLADFLGGTPPRDENR